MSESEQGAQFVSAADAPDGPSRRPSPTAGQPTAAAATVSRSVGTASESLMAGYDWRWPLVGAVIMLGVIGWLFADFFHRQFLWAVNFQADWGHTLVIPLIAGYFVYLNREKILEKPFRTTWIGLVPIVLGVAWYIFTSIGPQAIRHHNIQSLGVIATISGALLLFLGFRAFLWLIFPLAYLFIFGQTISDRFMNLLTFRLQDIAARGSHVVLVLMGIDTDRTGNLLTVWHNGEPKPLNIAEACSGMRMLMAFLALGVAMAYTMLKHNWQRIILVLMAVPTAIFVNVLRVVTLALLSFIDVNFAAGDFHTFVGLVWLLPAFLIYLGCMWVVTNIVIEEEETATSAASGQSTPRKAASSSERKTP